MTHWLFWGNWAVLILTDILLGLMVFSSFKEKETRATVISLLGLLVNSSLWSLLILFHRIEILSTLNILLFAFIGVFILISTVKWFPVLQIRDTSSAIKYDERDYMFSRNALKGHPELMKRYYEAHPEKHAIDSKIHQKPEIGEKGATYYNESYSPVFDAAFAFLQNTRHASTGNKASEKKKLDPEKMSKLLKNLGRYYGAVDVGITPLKGYHKYSHSGRHVENWGEAIHLDHQTAIVIIVAMDVAMIKGAPALPAILESSRHYVEAAKIANVMGYYIRSLGYEARAHTDGNYQVMCVPLAVDAGLGELGRLGIFLHPVYGPCVRISIVTTELELIPGQPLPHPNAAAIHHFCKICKKCADNCPTQSIHKEKEPESQGFRHWSINQESCFSFWKSIGTDCGFCIAVCPYTKPDTFIHKLVRFYISRNPVNQYIALLMDDLFYGRKKPIPAATENPPF